MDPLLWKVENYLEFLEARKALLTAEVNDRMGALLHGDTEWLEGKIRRTPSGTSKVPGGITNEQEEEQLEALNKWIEGQDLPRGALSYDFADAETGEQKAVFDLAWPMDLQWRS